jgi:tricorn protease
VSEIPKTAEGSNDSNPQWIGGTVYFRSDRNGEFNLFAFDTETKSVSQLTEYNDFPVISLSSHGKTVIYEQNGYLHVFDPASGSSTKMTIGIATDLLELRPRFVSGENYIRSVSISPSGARVAFDYRGEIVTVPAKKGDPSNLTQSPGVHEKYPNWSPSGKHLAYFSDKSGEYALHIKSVKDGSVQIISLSGTGFYANLNWSPDSKKICFVDNGRNLYVLDISSKENKKIASDELYIPGPFRGLFGSWSSDSHWITYTIVTDTNFERAYVYSIDQNQSFALSDGLSSVSEPTFDPSGKYIYMLASTDAGPVINWFDQSNQDMEMSNSIYLVTLQDDLISPLAKENDEEEGEEEVSDENTDSSNDKKSKSKKKKTDTEEEEEETKTIKIDWEGIDTRIIALPLDPGNYYNLYIPEEGQIYFISAKPYSGYDDPQSIRKFDLKEKKDTVVMHANWFQIAAGGKKMLYRKGQTWGITDVGKKPENGNLNISAIQVKIEPQREWENIFNEAWRVNRDYFYDPGMHGLDWNAMKEKYKVFLPDLTCRSDLYRVMQWMFSEVSVGHHRFGSTGDRLNNPSRVGGGLLGADYEIANNRYRFAKIYGGLNWTPDLRSPLTEPGVNIEVGEYLLAVNGKNVLAEHNLYRFFENTADKIVELTVGPNPDQSDARKVKVVPLSNESSLRHRDWVEGNLKKVHEATDGQVAYVYVPNTAGAGHEYFKRYFFPQANKKAIIVDERHNGGGQLADYYIDILKKPYQAHWNFRYGKDLKAPSASIQGPKVMLIDETAGSGGDYLPWMFRKFELGTLIGKRTWGGLVGVLGYPEFIDGGSVTAPNVAFWNEDGFRIENEGIAPDIEVEQWPKDVIAGHDPQLEKAIEILL